jgi:hypothetical protein
MFSGGDDAVVGRWLENFVRSHAKRADPRAEAVVDTELAARRFAVRVRVGDRSEPPAGLAPLALSLDEVAARRGDLAWCASQAARIRELATRASLASAGARQSA